MSLCLSLAHSVQVSAAQYYLYCLFCSILRGARKPVSCRTATPAWPMVLVLSWSASDYCHHHDAHTDQPRARPIVTVMIGQKSFFIVIINIIVATSITNMCIMIVGYDATPTARHDRIDERGTCTAASILSVQSCRQPPQCKLLQVKRASRSDGRAKAWGQCKISQNLSKRRNVSENCKA